MNHSIQELILERTSRRSYEATEIGPDLLSKIEKSLKSSSQGPLGTTIEFSIVKKDAEENKKLKLGTYGFISGARYFIVGQTKPETISHLDYGYLLEKVILELTGLNLGTCWLGGTFDRGEFAKSINLKVGNVIPAITPMGFPTQNRSLGDRVIRLGAGSKKRKPWGSLFFGEVPEQPLIQDRIDEKFSIILEMLRLAPSASNIQPWRIIKKDNTFQFYLERKPGYGKVFGKIDLQMIDMGIAMCHFDLTAKQLDYKPVWNISDDSEQYDGWEYIISATL